MEARNPYYQAFYGMREFQQKLLCPYSTELVHFRKRIGKDGLKKIFQTSIGLHGESILKDTVNIDATVHEKISHTPRPAGWSPKLLAG